MAGQTEELRQFLLGVQSNLESTLAAVSQKLHELKTDDAPSAVSVSQKLPPLKLPPRKLHELKDTPQNGSQTDDAPSAVSVSQKLPPLKDAPETKIQIDDAASAVSLKEAKADGAFALPGQFDLLPLDPTSSTSHYYETRDTHVTLAGSDSIAQNLLLYSLDDHRKKSLGQTLHEMRKANELPRRFWNRQIHIEDAYGKELAKNIVEFDDIQFPVTVKWEWLNKKDFPKFSYYKTAKFYWIGLTDSQLLRENFMRIRARLRLLSLKAEAVSNDWMDDVQMQRDALRNAEVVTFVTSMQAQKDGQEIHETQIRMTQDALRKLETLLFCPISASNKSWSTAELFQMTGCALDGFLDDYLSERDAALNSTKNRALKRRELVKALAKGAETFEFLCESLHDRLNQIDQLHFKIALMASHLVTVVAHLIYAYAFHHKAECSVAGAD